eukprot:6194558-Pleurochrysis_carterae.AAC.2
MELPRNAYRPLLYRDMRIYICNCKRCHVEHERISRSAASTSWPCDFDAMKRDGGEVANASEASVTTKESHNKKDPYPPLSKTAQGGNEAETRDRRGREGAVMRLDQCCRG